MNLLSRGSLGRLLKGDKSVGINVQVVKINHQSGRYQVTLFDGVESSTAIVASQINSLIADQLIKVFSIIEINDFNMQMKSDGIPLILLLAVSLVDNSITEDLSKQIGNQQQQNIPVPFNSNITSVYGNNHQPSTFANVYGNPSASFSNNPYGAIHTTQDIYGNGSGSFGNSGNNVTYSNIPSSYGGNTVNNKPIIRNDADTQSIIPITALNPYSQKWTIKARITSKSEIRTWNNAKGMSYH